MVIGEAISKKSSSSTISHDIESLWDDKRLESELAEFNDWANVCPASDTIERSTAADEPRYLGTTSTRNSGIDIRNVDNLDSNDDHSPIPDRRRIYVPKANQCGIWHDSPNKERHAASFGEGGTTASASCFGDLLQMSQYLGVGSSGVFTMDQVRTSQPYWVVQRAEDLDNLTRAIRDEYSFSLVLPDEYLADEANPPDVKWVNWRWPRYEYHARNNDSINVCFQYMTHGGVVLQQFTLENTDEKPVEVGPFRIESTVRIRDLDFLEPDDDENEESHRLGPNGYGHVCVRLLPDGCQGHAVASVSTTFLNGSAVKCDEQDDDNSTFLDKFELGGTASSQNKVEIVVARKLLALPKGPSDWRNFVISAQDGNINHWLREEEESWHEGDEQTTPCLATLAVNRSKGTNTLAARVGTDPQGANEEATALNVSEYGGSSAAAANLQSDWKSFNMPSGTSNPSENWNPKDHFEYLAWRHLEHILCVCAIPLSPPGLVEVSESGEVKTAVLESSPPVALTCGDMSGHRINSAASFFAFKFLVDVRLRLGTILQRKTKYTRSLETRINKVCSGHVRWLDHVRKIDYKPLATFAQRPPWSDEDITNEYITQVGCFAANYWVTGKMTVEHLDSLSWQPQNRMTDTALQILKLAEFKKLVLNSKDMTLSMARDLLNDIYVPWLTELDRLDSRKSCSWPHSNMEGIMKFRLDDHFWIWKALKFLDDTVAKVRLPPKHRGGHSKEILGVHTTWLQRLYTKVSAEQRSSVDNASSTSDDEGEGEDSSQSAEDLKGSIRSFMEIVKRLSPNNLQRTILQRFTAENDVVKPARRMLTVTRSAMDMRFLLHARDTALLYGEDSGFFSPGSSFAQLWMNTIDAQLHQEENMYADSDNALRYALGIVMGVRGHRLSRTSGANELVKRSVNILIGAGGSDAFFPGQLDEGAREPTIFAEEAYRDHFYYAGFEINYVLLSSANRVVNIFSESETNLNAEYRAEGLPSWSRAPSPQRQPGQTELPKVLLKKGINIQVSSEAKNMTLVPDNQPEVIMKKFLPFTNAVPATNVTHIGDEWLYQYPDFLRGRLDIEESQISKVVDAAGRSSKSFVNVCREVLDESDNEDELPDCDAENGDTEIQLHIVDTRKGKEHLGKSHATYNHAKKRDKSIRYQIDDIEELCEFLRKPRTAWTAKKRMIWLPYANPATVLAFRVFSSERERNQLARFFERHALYTKEVLDETSMVLNEWRTELHLSFYLCERRFSPENGVGLPQHNHIVLSCPGHFDLEIRRASMSFRFDGDIFDRFWTCHSIEHMPISAFRGRWDHPFGFRDDPFDKQWSQRKVLELYFLDRILEKMNAASAQLLTKMRETLEIEQVSLPLASLTSKASIEDLQRFEKVLQLVEEDLTANLDTLSEKWNRREKDRGAEKPRWTPNDEKKYRASINKLSVDVERATGRLKATQDDIRKLKEFLATTQKNMRDDADRERDKRDRARADRDRERDERDRARAEKDRIRDADIRYLTYVTVIFQPLGFAASFYSMGGAPEPSLIVSLVEFSAAAFAVTLVLIWGYRAIASRDDEDGVLQKFSRKSIKQHKDTKQALKDEKHKLSLQNVVHLGRGQFERIAHYILTVLRWCWDRVYKRPRELKFPSFPPDVEKQPSDDPQGAVIGDSAALATANGMPGPSGAGQGKRGRAQAEAEAEAETEGEASAEGQAVS